MRWTSSAPRPKATFEEEDGISRAQELLCEGRGGRTELPVPNSPHGLCGCEATSEEEEADSNRAQELCEGRSGRLKLPSLIVLMVPVGVKQH